MPDPPAGATTPGPGDVPDPPSSGGAPLPGTGGVPGAITAAGVPTSLPASGEIESTAAIPDAPMPPPAPVTLGHLRRPPRVFRNLREWIQTRLLALVAALGEFLALFALVLSVILGSIFVLSNRIVYLQVMTPSKMGGSYAPDGKARYTAGAIGQAFSIAFVDGAPAKPVPIAASGAALPAVRPKLADEARAENSARDALLSAGGGFQASADTRAALAAPVLAGKLLASLAAKGAGAANLVIPTRGTGPPPTRAVPSPTQTVPPTATVPVPRSPTVAPTRPLTSPTVVPTPVPATQVPSPTITPLPRATPVSPVPTVTPPSPSATVRPTQTPVPPTATVPASVPTAAATIASPSPIGGTPTIPVLPTVTAAPASPTVPAPSSPTAPPSPTPNVSPTPRPEPSATFTHTPTQTPTSTPTPTPTREGGPSPTALAMIDFSTLVAIPGQPVITSFPGIFSTGSANDPNAGTPAPLPAGPGREYSRTLLFVNGSNKPIDFISQTGVDTAYADNPLWADVENGLQMEITIDGMTRYLGPLDTTRAATPPFLERIPANSFVSIGFRIFLPTTAGNAMSRQTVVFNVEFAVTRY